MVDVVARHFEQTREETGIGAMSASLRDALLQVPRHRFVRSGSRALAYADTALSIGFGQTISQPFIVALMIELAGVTPESRVLEVGTGGGYQAAVLGSIASEVYTIERVSELANESAALLDELGFDRVETRCGDGFEGWPEAAPFDAILVTACSSEAPSPLIAQLKVGGRMVIPVGTPRAYQELRVVEKIAADEVVVRHGLPVAFVPLVHAVEESP